MQDIQHAAVNRIFRAKSTDSNIQAEQPGPLGEQITVTNNHQLHIAGKSRQPQTKLRTDTGWLAAGYGYHWAHYCSSSRRFST